jgi:hypothetical protein
MAEIQIVGPIDKNTILDLRGSIVSAFVSPAFGSQPIPFEDFFRFARVLRVEIAARDGEDAPPCPRCEEPARYRLVVEWEAFHRGPDTNVLCEHCVLGVVTMGAEFIPFGDDEPLVSQVKLNFINSLRPEQTGE